MTQYGDKSAARLEHDRENTASRLRLTTFGPLREPPTVRQHWEQMLEAESGLSLMCPFGDVAFDSAAEHDLVYAYEWHGVPFDVADPPHRLRRRGYEWAHAFAARQLKQIYEDEREIERVNALARTRRGA